jgi:DNA-directed RNA polymerase specialized sigma24 family protein
VRGEIEAVDAAVTALEREDEALAEVVVLRFFGGLTNAQVAEVTNVSARTVNKRWSMAKVWLARWLEGKGGRGR